MTKKDKILDYIREECGLKELSFGCEVDFGTIDNVINKEAGFPAFLGDGAIVIDNERLSWGDTAFFFPITGRTIVVESLEELAEKVGVRKIEIIGHTPHLNDCIFALKKVNNDSTETIINLVERWDYTKQTLCEQNEEYFDLLGNYLNLE